MTILIVPTRPARALDPTDATNITPLPDGTGVLIHFQADRYFVVMAKGDDLGEILGVNNLYSALEWREKTSKALPKLMAAINEAFETQPLRETLDEVGNIVPAVTLSGDDVRGAL